MADSEGRGETVGPPNSVLLLGAAGNKRRRILLTLKGEESDLVVEVAESASEAMLLLERERYTAILAIAADAGPDLPRLVRERVGQANIIILVDSWEDDSLAEIDPTGKVKVITTQIALKHPQHLITQIYESRHKPAVSCGGPRTVGEGHRYVSHKAFLFSRAISNLKLAPDINSFYLTAARALAEMGEFRRAFIALEERGGELKLVAVVNASEEIRKLYESGSKLFFAGLDNFLTPAHRLYPNIEIYSQSRETDTALHGRPFPPPPWLKGCELLLPLIGSKSGHLALVFLDEALEPGALEEDSLRLVESLGRHIALCLEHRELQKALLRAETQRIDLISSLNLVTLRGDGNGRILEISPYASILLGLEPELLRGRNILDFVVAEDLERARDLFTRVPQGTVPKPDSGVLRHPHTMLRLRSASGETRHTIAKCTVSYKREGDQLAVTGSEGIIIDLSEHLQQREEKVRPKQVLASVFESIDAPVIGYDGKGRLQIYNKAAEHAFGYTYEEVAKTDWTHLVKPVYRNMIQVLAAAQSFEDLAALHADQWEVTCKDGSRKVVEIRCSQIADEDTGENGIIAIIEDLGAERLLESELIGANVELQARINELETLVRTGSIISSASSISELFKEISAEISAAYPQYKCSVALFDERKRSVAGSQHGTAPPDGKMEPGKRRVSDLALERKKSVIVADLEMEAGLAALERDSLSAIAVPVISANRTYGVITLESDEKNQFTDDERKVLESVGYQLAKAMENIELQSRVKRRSREINNILYAVSLDLKSPLNALNGLLELFRDTASSKLSPQEETLLSKFRSNLQYLNSLVSSISQLSSFEGRTKKYSRVDLGKSVESVKMQVFTRFADEPLPRVSMPSPLPVVITDDLILCRVLLELFTNALKFRRPNIELRIEVTAIPQANETLLCVKDNGIGISRKHLDQIFDLFYTVQPRGRRGLGMGLYLAKHLVQMLGGTIWCESTPGDGAAIKFTIPTLDETLLQEQGQR